MKGPSRSTFREFSTFRRYIGSLNINRIDAKPGAIQLKGHLSRIFANYLQQLNEEPKTSRPSHYNDTAEYDQKNYYRKRYPQELSSPKEAPYQHHHYQPPNDKTTQLYNNFRDNSRSRSAVALREHAPRRFVPGDAQPYLLNHARLYSNHYQRLAFESETGEICTVWIIYFFVLFGAFIELCPAWFHYVSPEYGGAPSWG